MTTLTLPTLRLTRLTSQLLRCAVHASLHCFRLPRTALLTLNFGLFVLHCCCLRCCAVGCVCVPCYSPPSPCTALFSALFSLLLLLSCPPPRPCTLVSPRIFVHTLGVQEASLRLRLEIRAAQLNAACTLELWQLAFESAEELHLVLQHPNNRKAQKSEVNCPTSFS